MGCEHLAVIHVYHSTAHWPTWATETPRWTGNPADTKPNNSNSRSVIPVVYIKTTMD